MDERLHHRRQELRVRFVIRPRLQDVTQRNTYQPGDDEACDRVPVKGEVQDAEFLLPHRGFCGGTKEQR